MRGNSAHSDQGPPRQGSPVRLAGRSNGAGVGKPVLRLTLFGSVALFRNDRPLDIKSRKALALLGFLNLDAASRTVSRERLCGLLWSESPEEKARASLRQALHELKSVIEAEDAGRLQAGRETVGLGGAWTTDVAEILARLQAGEVVAQLLDHKTIASSLLPECEDLDPSFRTWLMAQRQLVQEQLTRGLKRLLQDGGGTSEPSERSQQAAEALLNLDPTDEEACRHLMRGSVARGDVGGALKVYRRLWDLLDEEYGTEPSAQTQALAVEIKSFTLSVQPAVPERTSANSDVPSIAVLPFNNMSGDPEQEYLADGIVEDITTALSRIRWFFVMARNSSFTYKGRDVDVREVSRHLGVRYVLEGSVRRSGTRLRINAQLVDAATGHHMWADRYDGAGEDVFTFQDQITEAVVGAIEPSIRRAEIERATRKSTSSLAAYDRVLRALPLIAVAEKQGIVAAQDHLSHALDQDPDYAHALALEARCCALKLQQGWGAERDRAEGVRCAQRAIALGGNDPLALAEAAVNLAFLAGEYSTALVAIERSLKLHPSAAETHNKAGWIRAYVGEAALAFHHFETAIRLSPHDLAMCHFLTGYAMACLLVQRWEDACRYAQQAITLNPGWGSAHRVRAVSLVELGCMADARIAAERVLEIAPYYRLSNQRKYLPRHWGHYWHRWTDCLRIAGLPE